MKNTKPIKIDNVSSSLFICNLHPNQKIFLNNNFRINKNSDFLECSTTENYQSFSQSDKIKSWNFSNFYLGNLEIQNIKKNICVLLSLGSKIYTIINPKNSKIKIDSNKILEIILFSKSNQKFAFQTNNFLCRYNIFNNFKLDNIVPQGFYTHHIWVSINQIGFFRFQFDNDFNKYSLDLHVRKSKQKQYDHYIRNISLTRK